VIQVLRARSRGLLITLALALSSPAVAQVEVAIPGQGKMSTVSKVENGILGVTNMFTRDRAAAKECVGACFYARATRMKTWTCRNSTECNLDCSGREPVGECRDAQ
jgi:hypothetical protein